MLQITRKELENKTKNIIMLDYASMLYLDNCGLLCSYFKNNVVELEKVLRKMGRTIKMME